MKHASIGEMTLARNASAPRKPLRSANELAKEFGITGKRLGSLLRVHNGPKPILANRQGTVKAHWYDPDQMRAWWKVTKPLIKDL